MLPGIWMSVKSSAMSDRFSNIANAGVRHSPPTGLQTGVTATTSAAHAQHLIVFDHQKPWTAEGGAGAQLPDAFTGEPARMAASAWFSAFTDSGQFTARLMMSETFWPSNPDEFDIPVAMHASLACAVQRRTGSLDPECRN